MNIITFLNKKGYDTVSSEHYRMVQVWESWYRNKVRGFHRYKINNGSNTVRCDRLSAGMAKMVSEDLADDLMNEKVQITVSDSSANDYVHTVLENNNWSVQSNTYQERKSYTGTVAYVPYLDEVEIEEDGTVIPGSGTVKINYFEASNIFPLSWSNGWLRNVHLFQFTRLKERNTPTYSCMSAKVREWNM